MYILNKGEQNMNKENVDLNSMPKQEVIDMLALNTVMSLYKHNIQHDLLFHKTTLTGLEQLVTNVVNNADKKTLKLLGTDISMTYAGLGRRVIDMLESVGVQIEYPTSTTLQQLNELEGRLVVDQNG